MPPPPQLTLGYAEPLPFYKYILYIFIYTVYVYYYNIYTYIDYYLLIKLFFILCATWICIISTAQQIAGQFWDNKVRWTLNILIKARNTTLHTVYASSQMRQGIWTKQKSLLLILLVPALRTDAQTGPSVPRRVGTHRRIENYSVSIGDAVLLDDHPPHLRTLTLTLTLTPSPKNTNTGVGFNFFYDIDCQTSNLTSTAIMC